MKNEHIVKQKPSATRSLQARAEKPEDQNATRNLQSRSSIVCTTPQQQPAPETIRIVRVETGPPASVVNNYITNVGGVVDKGFETFINNPAATWIIPHTLGRKPDVAVYDATGKLMIADVQSSNTITTVTFAFPTTGSVVLS